MNGQYFEWCANYSVARCLDSMHDMTTNVCALANETDKKALWALSASWVQNYSSPILDEPAAKH